MTKVQVALPIPLTVNYCRTLLLSRRADWAEVTKQSGDRPQFLFQLPRMHMRNEMTCEGKGYTSPYDVTDTLPKCHAVS